MREIKLRHKWTLIGNYLWECKCGCLRRKMGLRYLYENSQTGSSSYYAPPCNIHQSPELQDELLSSFKTIEVLRLENERLKDKIYNSL